MGEIGQTGGQTGSGITTKGNQIQGNPGGNPGGGNIDTSTGNNPGTDSGSGTDTGNKPGGSFTEPTGNHAAGQNGGTAGNPGQPDIISNKESVVRDLNPAPKIIPIPEKKRGRGRPRKNESNTLKTEPAEIKPPKVEKVKSEKIPLNKDDITFFIFGLFETIATVPGQEHWRISLEEVERISGPLTRILKRLEVSETVGKYSDAAGLIIAAIIIIGPRVNQSLKNRGKGGNKLHVAKPLKSDNGTATEQPNPDNTGENKPVDVGNFEQPSGAVDDGKTVNTTPISQLFNPLA